MLGSEELNRRYEAARQERAFQVLVLPFRKRSASHSSGPLHDYAVLKRADMQVWQGVAGGGKLAEEPIEAARREASEEAGVDPAFPFIALESIASIQLSYFPDLLPFIGQRYVVMEYAFAVECPSDFELRLSGEHVDGRWSDFAIAYDLLKWDSNRTALWELHARLTPWQRADQTICRRFGAVTGDGSRF